MPKKTTGSGDITLYHEYPEKVFSRECSQLRRSRLSTVPLWEPDECAWPDLPVGRWDACRGGAALFPDHVFVAGI